MGHKPAGGLKSRNVVSKPVRTGAGARGIDKKWVSQVGQSIGNHVTMRGESLKGVRAVDPIQGSFNESDAVRK
jgi:hypothetical protein